MSELNYNEATRVAKVIATRTRGESNYVTIQWGLLVEALKEAYLAGFNEANRESKEGRKA